LAQKERQMNGLVPDGSRRRRDSGNAGQKNVLCEG
jgi:hypothetical protein